MPYTSAQSARASLRRDSPMDPLVEARRVVLKDLADHPISAAPDAGVTPVASAMRAEGDDAYPDTPHQWQVCCCACVYLSAISVKPPAQSSYTWHTVCTPWQGLRMYPRQSTRFVGCCSHAGQLDAWQFSNDCRYIQPAASGVAGESVRLCQLLCSSPGRQQHRRWAAQAMGLGPQPQPSASIQRRIATDQQRRWRQR